MAKNALFMKHNSVLGGWGVTAPKPTVFMDLIAIQAPFLASIVNANRKMFRCHILAVDL